MERLTPFLLAHLTLSLAIGDAAIKLTSTARLNELCPGEFITFHCIANGSRLTWTLNSMTEFSFDHLESVELIIHKPLPDSYATLLPRGDGLWESTYTLLSVQSSGSMTVACFNGSASEELTISVIITATDTTSANGELKIILYVIGVVAAVSGPSSAVIAGVIIIKWKQRQCAVKSKGKKVDIMDKISHSEKEQQDGEMKQLV